MIPTDFIFLFIVRVVFFYNPSFFFMIRVDPSPILFYFFFDPSWSESIRVDPTRAGGPSWSGPTFVPALYLKELLFHSEVVFTLFFWYEVEFLLGGWLRQCWSIWHVNILYCSFLFRKDWLILNQTKCSLTNKIFDEQMCTQAKHTSLTVSIKFINGKIWVFTPL